MEDFERKLLAADGFLDLGMFAEAWAELDRIAAGEQERAEVLIARVRLTERLKLWPEQLRAAWRLQEMFPDNAQWLLFMVQACDELGDLEHSRIVVEEAARRFPQKTGVLYQRARLAGRLGHVAEARERLRAVLAMPHLDADTIRGWAAKDPAFADLWPELAGL